MIDDGKPLFGIHGSVGPKYPQKQFLEPKWLWRARVDDWTTHVLMPWSELQKEVERIAKERERLTAEQQRFRQECRRVVEALADMHLLTEVRLRRLQGLSSAFYGAFGVSNYHAVASLPDSACEEGTTPEAEPQDEVNSIQAADDENFHRMLNSFGVFMAMNPDIGTDEKKIAGWNKQSERERASAAKQVAERLKVAYEALAGYVRK